MVRRIILAAGHGGGDSGAVGQGTTEAAECIQIVNRMADKFRVDGQVEVVVVPHELNLGDEINWINARYKKLEDGIAIEVHKNSTSNAHGIEVWYYSGDSQSQQIAQTILNGIMSVPNMPVSRGVKGDATNRFGRLGWVRDTNTWAVLAEMGFVSDGGDPVDDSADERYAEGAFRGALNALGLLPRNIPAPEPVPEAPAPNVPKWRVYGPDGKQIGAYNTESGAWKKYALGGAKIIETATGLDVTGYFVDKYRPIDPEPPTPNPHPEYDPSKDKEQDNRLSALESFMNAIKALLAKIGINL